MLPCRKRRRGSRAPAWERGYRDLPFPFSFFPPAARTFFPASGCRWTSPAAAVLPSAPAACPQVVFSCWPSPERIKSQAGKNTFPLTAKILGGPGEPRSCYAVRLRRPGFPTRPAVGRVGNPSYPNADPGNERGMLNSHTPLCRPRTEPGLLSRYEAWTVELAQSSGGHSPWHLEGTRSSRCRVPYTTASARAAHPDKAEIPRLTATL